MAECQTENLRLVIHREETGFDVATCWFLLLFYTAGQVFRTQHITKHMRKSFRAACGSSTGPRGWLIFSPTIILMLKFCDFRDHIWEKNKSEKMLHVAWNFAKHIRKKFNYKKAALHCLLSHRHTHTFNRWDETLIKTGVYYSGLNALLAPPLSCPDAFQ